MKKLIIAILALLFITPVFATDLTMSLGDSADLSGGFSSKIIQMIVIITILSVAPSIVVMFSSFIKIAVVLSILRNALGLQQTPPNSVLASLTLFLTFFVMQPTLKEIYDDALEPLMEQRITNEMAWDILQVPVKNFMLQNTADKELGLFRAMGKVPESLSRDESPIYILTPAFMISELRKGFEIGFLIFLPFLIIDLVVSSVLMAMGMMMLPPVTISLPFKLIFFVLVDGWYMICGSLVKSYGL